MPYTTNKTLRPRGDAVLVTGGNKKDASIDDVRLLDSGHRPTERWLSSNGFRGQVDVLLNNGVQRFQPLEEGQRISILAYLVVAYVDDFLVDVDVQVDAFLHGEALRGDRGLEVHILRRDLRHLQGHQGLKEFVTMERVAGNEEPGRAGWSSTTRSSARFLAVVNLQMELTIMSSMQRGEAGVDEG